MFIFIGKDGKDFPKSRSFFIENERGNNKEKNYKKPTKCGENIVEPNDA